MPVEHQIVRPLQGMLAAFVEHGFDLAGCEIDALQRAADIFARPRRARHQGAARPAASRSRHCCRRRSCRQARAPRHWGRREFPRRFPCVRRARPGSAAGRGSRPAPPSRPASPPALPGIRDRWRARESWASRILPAFLWLQYDKVSKNGASAFGGFPGSIPHAQRFRCATLWQSRSRLPSNRLWCASSRGVFQLPQARQRPA